MSRRRARSLRRTDSERQVLNKVLTDLVLTFIHAVFFCVIRIRDLATMARDYASSSSDR